MSIHLNTCCNVRFLAEQTINKPHYTPGKALRKCFKLLRRVLKSSSSSSKRKVVSTGEQQIVAQHCVKVPEQHKNGRAEAATNLNDSVLTTCSTLSVEEFENELNELAELKISTNKASAIE